MREHDDGDTLDHPETELQNFLYQLDNVRLTTIGVDVGSSTLHLMFARVHLHRETESLSSRFTVVKREVLWRSDIVLTPYRGRLIDADAVGDFVAECHAKAGLTSADIDSGAVIFTGEALRQRNARALADAIAAGSGKFVCVSAGHHLEAMLAAHGSGAVEYSKSTGARLLHIDIGGGTTKISLIEGGLVRGTAAVMIGGRQIAWNRSREIISTTAGAKTIARRAEIDITVGTTFSTMDEKRFVTAQAEVLFAIANNVSNDLARRLRLTRVLPKLFSSDTVSFSGGVSEYIYGREAGDFGDLGHALGQALRMGIENRKIMLPIADPGEGVRATVIGASQCSVQLSGSTVMVSDPSILPIHNVPVVHPQVRVSSDESPLKAEEITDAIKRAVAIYGLTMEDPLALSFSWRGDPSYQRMKDFAQGVKAALNVNSAEPVIVLVDDDLGASIGRILVHDFPITRPMICLDSLTLSPFDYVDVGAVLEPSGAVPVIIKSLLFSTD